MGLYRFNAKHVLSGLLAALFSVWMGSSIALYNVSTLSKIGLMVIAIVFLFIYFFFCHFKPVIAYSFSVCFPFILISMFNFSLDRSVMVGFALCFLQFVTIIFGLTKTEKFKVFKYEKSIVFLVILWLYSAFIGLVARNDFVYWIGDSYRFLVIPFYYFLSVNVFQDRKQIKTFCKYIFIVMMSVTVGEIINMSISGYARDGSASSTYLILASMATSINQLS